MKRSQKEQLIGKLVETTSLLGIGGTLDEDGQSLFIAHAIMTVLTAAQDEKHAMVLSRNLNNFVDEINVLEGKMSLGEFFEQKMSQN